MWMILVDRYMCVWWDSVDSHTSSLFKKEWFFSSELCLLLKICESLMTDIGIWDVIAGLWQDLKDSNECTDDRYADLGTKKCKMIKYLYWNFLVMLVMQKTHLKNKSHFSVWREINTVYVCRMTHCNSRHLHFWF